MTGTLISTDASLRLLSTLEQLRQITQRNSPIYDLAQQAHEIVAAGTLGEFTPVDAGSPLVAYEPKCHYGTVGCTYAGDDTHVCRTPFKSTLFK